MGVLRSGLIAMGIIAMSPATACNIPDVDPRLRLHCDLARLSGRLIPAELANMLDQRLKRNGIAAGIGRGRTAPAVMSFGVFPTLGYEPNLNGGNPRRALVLGGLTLKGEDHLYRTSGVVAGLRLGLSGQHGGQHGTALRFDFGLSHARSTAHQSDISSAKVSACGSQHLGRWWFVDLCADAMRAKKDLSDVSVAALSLSGLRVYRSKSGGHRLIKLGLSRQFGQGYRQHQVSVSHQTLYPNGALTRASLLLGEAVPNHMLPRVSIRAGAATRVAGYPLSLMAEVTKTEGAKLLSFDRRDQYLQVEVGFTPRRDMHITAGYRLSDSNIDYFDTVTPVFGIRFSPFRL